MSPINGLGLLSGGLDSMLAAAVVKEQGIDVTAISFETPFFSSRKAKTAASQLDVPLLVRDITRPHLEIMLKPKHGFGSNMNPCIDCHILMLKVASDIMKEQGFDFIFTGEVLNERPMSQNRRALRIVQEESGCGGYLLRPLSAKLLDVTIPEKEGVVDRNKLLALQGRTRKPQMELAKKYNLDSYPSPAGGCLLTDPGFSRRLRELMDREGLGDVRDIELLKIGRHFRLKSGRKAIVGRNREENEELESLTKDGDVLLDPVNVPGPVVLITRGGDPEDMLKAASLCARYSDARAGEEVVVKANSGRGITTLFIPAPAPEDITVPRV